jgi:hypothetical protein
MGLVSHAEVQLLVSLGDVLVGRWIGDFGDKFKHIQYQSRQIFCTFPSRSKHLLGDIQERFLFCNPLFLHVRGDGVGTEVLAYAVPACLRLSDHSEVVIRHDPGTYSMYYKRSSVFSDPIVVSAFSPVILNANCKRRGVVV